MSVVFDVLIFQENIECKVNLAPEVTANVADLLDGVGHSVVIT